MEFSIPSESARNYVNFPITMDYDSGYMSHNQESNSDTSLENATEPAEHATMENSLIYLSEDALLEKPVIAKTDTTNSPDTVLNSSVQSQESDLSGFKNDSDMSLEIPLFAPIIVENKELDHLQEQDKESKQCGNENFALNIPELTKSSFSSEESFNGFKENIGNNINENFHTESKATFQMCGNDCNDPQSVCSSDKENEPPKLHSECSENFVFTLPSLTLDTPTSNSNDSLSKDSLKHEQKRLTLVFSKNEENRYSVKRKYPSMTPEKKIQNSFTADDSPDLFDNDEPEDLPVSSSEILAPLDFIAEEHFVLKKDQRLIKRLQNGLNGVPPPPSVTGIQMSVVEMLDRLGNNKQYFWASDGVLEKGNDEENNTSLNSSNDSADGFKSLLLNVSSENEFANKEWPHVMDYRFHGLHHNRSKVSEDLEDLCDKYAKRFVGAETQSSCTVFDTRPLSPSKRGQARAKWTGGTKSPGRRLSHLARRRITFSSANLLQSGSSALVGMRARQILVDARKLDLLNRRKSPKKSPRKTPKKTPRRSPRVKTRTPSSSAKKKLAMRFRELTGEFEKSVPSTSAENPVLSSKRALFSSPQKHCDQPKGSSSLSTKRTLFRSPSRDKNSSLFLPSTSSTSLYQPGESSKPTPCRALFKSPVKTFYKSPNKNSPRKLKSPLKQLFEGKKRKRVSESDENQPSKLTGDCQPSKVARGVSSDLRDASRAAEEKKLLKQKSESGVSTGRSCTQNELSDMQKKRLQWAVYESLRAHNVLPTHSQFKTFASTLARVTRRFLPISTDVTGDRMLRIARHHSYAVVKGKTVDDIVAEFLKNRGAARGSQRLSQQMMVEEKKSGGSSKPSSSTRKDVLQDRSNTIESWEKRKLEQLGKPKGTENRIERIKKVINFGDDNR